MAGIVLLVVVALLAVWIVAGYNRLVAMRNQALNGWRQIDVQLKRRHDLIPNLVNAVRGSMDFERDTLTAVMEARSKALTATGPSDAAQKEQQLTQTFFSCDSSTTCRDSETVSEQFFQCCFSFPSSS